MKPLGKGPPKGWAARVRTSPMLACATFRHLIAAKHAAADPCTGLDATYLQRVRCRTAQAGVLDDEMCVAARDHDLTVCSVFE